MSLRDYLFYEEPGVTLYCGDCREVLPLLWYDAVIADPPYGIGMRFGDGQSDSPDAFRAAMVMLSGLQVPTAVTIPSTRIYDVPRPAWLGVWRKPMAFGCSAPSFYPHWDAIAFYHIGNKDRRSPDVWSCSSLAARAISSSSPGSERRGSTARWPLFSGTAFSRF